MWSNPLVIIDAGSTELSDSRLNEEALAVARWFKRDKWMSATLLAAAIAGLALAGTGYWTLWQTQNEAVDDAWAPALVAFPERRPLAEFILVDDAKRVFDLKSLQARWSFLFFGFMYCPDICPTTLYDLSKVRAALYEHGLSEKDVQFVFISVDPARDKAAKLQRYVEYFDPSFVATTGSVGQLTNLTRQLGAPFRTEPETAENVYEVTHSSAIYLVDPKGQYAGIISPPFVTADVANQFVSLYETTQPPMLALAR